MLEEVGPRSGLRRAFAQSAGLPGHHGSTATSSCVPGPLGHGRKSLVRHASLPQRCVAGGQPVRGRTQAREVDARSGYRGQRHTIFDDIVTLHRHAVEDDARAPAIPRSPRHIESNVLRQRPPQWKPMEHRRAVQGSGRSREHQDGRLRPARVVLSRGSELVPCRVVSASRVHAMAQGAPPPRANPLPDLIPRQARPECLSSRDDGRHRWIGSGARRHGARVRQGSGREQPAVHRRAGFHTGASLRVPVVTPPYGITPSGRRRRARPPPPPSHARRRTRTRRPGSRSRIPAAHGRRTDARARACRAQEC